MAITTARPRRRTGILQSRERVQRPGDPPGRLGASGVGSTPRGSRESSSRPQPCSRARICAVMVGWACPATASGALDRRRLP
ncbi:hypothetical protein AB0D11_29015 [Streptomyces monashensis]|uniref:hypothetical protein n=1 Tax=Streptomyces monashensis TaxID=1678012 RepID=UPI0033EC2946